MNKINKKSLLITIAIILGAMGVVGISIMFPIVGIVLYWLAVLMALGVSIYFIIDSISKRE